MQRKTVIAFYLLPLCGLLISCAAPDSNPQLITVMEPSAVVCTIDGKNVTLSLHPGQRIHDLCPENSIRSLNYDVPKKYSDPANRSP